MADDLLSMFMSMGTSDHDQLVSQFCQVIPACNPEHARFFLEACNWNLQMAVCSLMDQGGQQMTMAQAAVPEATFVCDVTIGEGEKIPPGVEFVKTWRIQNSGAVKWPDNCVLVFTQGDNMGGPAFTQVAALAPGAAADVSVTLRAPREEGNYWGGWKLRTDQAYADLEIFVVIEVAEGGMLDTLQQMHATSVTPGAAAIFSPPQAPAAPAFGAAAPQAAPAFGQPAFGAAAAQPAFGQAAFGAGAAQPGFNPPAATAASGSFGIPAFGSLAASPFGSSFGAPAPAMQPGAGTLQPSAGAEGGMES